MRLIKKTVHVVGAIITNEQDEVLCALRGPGMELSNYWEFPGGKIEKGESKIDALKREIFEELGCEIDVKNQIEDTIYEYEKITVRLETFIATIKKGVPKTKEHAQLKWIHINKLMDLNWAPADLPAVRKLTKLKDNEI